MKAIFWAGVGTLFPFAMTVLGAALVFLFRDSRNGRTEQVCMGFAAGVMSAAAVFSMLIPAVEQVRQSGGAAWRTATLGFILGAASGLVEPVFGMLAALVVHSARMWMPGMMAFCAGAMMWVVIAEMIPEAAQGRAGVISAMAGYALMMALDIALG